MMSHFHLQLTRLTLYTAVINLIEGLWFRTITVSGDNPRNLSRSNQILNSRTIFRQILLRGAREVLWFVLGLQKGQSREDSKYQLGRWNRNRRAPIIMHKGWSLANSWIEGSRRSNNNNTIILRNNSVLELIRQNHQKSDKSPYLRTMQSRT